MLSDSIVVLIRMIFGSSQHGDFYWLRYHDDCTYE